MLSKEVLIVDDDEDICKLLSHVLKNNNIKSYTATTLTAAKRVLKQGITTHVFLDNVLPDGKGIDFIDYLKKYYPNIKIILSTGYYEEIEIGQIEEGEFEILKKPFTVDNVTQYVM